MVIGHARDIAEGRRLRKLLGGGMRQVGVLAAPALVALDEGLDRIAEDHWRAKRLAEAFGVDPETVDTNIVIAQVDDAPAAEAALAEEGVQVVAISPSEIRLVTHRDIDDAGVERALAAAKRIA
jgi:threonine aldolase